MKQKDKNLSDIKTSLQHLYNDTEMALNNTWDRSDHGFMAMQDNIETIADLLGIELDMPDDEE